MLRGGGRKLDDMGAHYHAENYSHPIKNAQVYQNFDSLAKQYGIFKIETVSKLYSGSLLRGISSMGTHLVHIVVRLIDWGLLRCCMR